MEFLINLFFIAFFLNLFYELVHSVLYTTCLTAPLKRYVYLILKASLFDGVVICLIYFFGYLLFPSYYIVFYITASLLFAYFWEVYSLKAGKWDYAKTMPIILGVGITPLMQLSVTGYISICILKYFFV